MKLLLKILLPVLVLVGSVFAAKTILENRPEPRTRPSFASIQAVDAITLAESNYPVSIRSQGTVQPTKSSTLVAEATGTVIELPEVFVVGGIFSEGDVLLQIDERDYSIALTQAQANLAQATAAMQEELARGDLAKSEWESLQNGRKASQFMLRVPQLAASRANRDAARAQVDRAKLDLDRTRFIAPYDGRVLEKSVNQGQFVSRGSLLGQIYSTNSVDVRLPLSNRQLTFLDIPTSGDVPQSLLPNIELSAAVGGVEQKWTGKVVRAEGVDAGTQQLNVIARVDNPYAAGKPPLHVGQYIEANIAGRVLEDVFVLPRSALREGREVLLVNKESQLERREVVVAWSDSETVAVSDGLEAGAVLVITPLSTVTNGTPVRATIDGKAPPKREGRPGGKPGGKPEGRSKGKPEGAAGENGKIIRGASSEESAKPVAAQDGEDARRQGKGRERKSGERGESGRGDADGSVNSGENVGGEINKRGDTSSGESSSGEARTSSDNANAGSGANQAQNPTRPAVTAATDDGADSSNQDEDAKAAAAAEAMIQEAVGRINRSTAAE